MHALKRPDRYGHMRYAYSSMLACTLVQHTRKYALFRSLETNTLVTRLIDTVSRLLKSIHFAGRGTSDGVASDGASRAVLRARASRHVTSRILRTPLAMRSSSSLLPSTPSCRSSAMPSFARERLALAPSRSRTAYKSEHRETNNKTNTSIESFAHDD